MDRGSERPDARRSHRRAKTRPLRIAYWCQFFWPEVAAPSRRLLDFGRVWTRMGHQVTVVTGMPNHPQGIVAPEYRGRVVASERKDGVRVLRSWVYASPNQAGFRKLLGHLSFAVSSGLSAARLGKTDVVIVSSPTMFVGFTGWLTARLRRATFVFEVRDLWPEAFIDLGVLRLGLITRVLGRMARFLYGRADLIAVVTESFADCIAAQGIAREKIVTIPNGADVDWFAEDVSAGGRQRRTELGLDGHTVVAYIGAQGASHGLTSVLDAAAACTDRDIRFLFVGDGSEHAHLVAHRRRRGLNRVVMLPQQPNESIREFYALADICLVPLRDVPIFESFLPSKMFEIMAAGRPIIGCVRGEAKQILERSGAAVVVAPEDPVALAAAVGELAGSPDRRRVMGSAGREFVAVHYSRQSLGEEYLRAIHAVRAP